jgi:hypothetical protein
VTRPRAADDFATIRERMNELRRETAADTPAEANRSTRADPPLINHDRRLKERREGLPPPCFLAASDEGVVGDCVPRSRAQIR